MNPVIFSGEPKNGVLEIPMSSSCSCYVGLVSISLPNIERYDYDENFHEINISCDQIDSTILNRKRLLRRICVEKNKDLYTTHEFANVMYFPIDSMDNKLTIHIKDQFGPIKLQRKISRKNNPQTITMTLNIIPKDVAADQWIRYI